MITDPRCERCKAFDAETKTLFSKCFSPPEISLISSMLAQNLATALRLRLKTIGEKAAQLQMQSDFIGQVIGKFYAAMSDDAQELFLANASKHLGISLRPQHERCPHQTKDAVGAACSPH